MPGTATFIAFSAATLVLLVIPGPSVLYIVTRSAAQGRRAGLVSVAGVHLGSMVHVAAAMVGLSTLLVTSAAAFTVVKYAGAAYLVWLGFQSFRQHRSSGSSLGLPQVEQRPLRRIFLDGAIVNLLNPKTAIFFLAYVPQFIEPETPHPATSVAVLGGLFIVLGLLSDGAYALAGGWIGTRIRRSERLRVRKDLVAGGTYIGLGAVAAFGGSHSTS